MNNRVLLSPAWPRENLQTGLVADLTNMDQCLQVGQWACYYKYAGVRFITSYVHVAYFLNTVISGILENFIQ